MRDHRKLKAFQLSDRLVLETYEATKSFPREELFGITSQLRRASVSVSANIVEGCARRTEKDFRHFLSNAFGSLRELGYLVDLATRLGFIDRQRAEALQNLHTNTSCRLRNLIKSLN